MGLFKAQVARKAITEKMRRMQSLDHTLENMKGRKISYNEVLRRMRKKATDEVNQMRLGNLNLWRKLRKFEKNMQHKMRELQSGKYSNMESLRKLEQWRQVKSRTWEKIARDTERKFKREETKEKRFVAALRRARMRAAGMLRNVARGLKKMKTHKSTMIETGHDLKVKTMLMVREKRELQKLMKLRVNYLRKLHEMEKDRFKLLGILSQEKLMTSRMLQHAVEEKMHWLKKGKVLRKRHWRRRALMYAQLKEQQDEAKKRLKKMRFQGGLKFRKMVWDQKHTFNRAAVKKSNLFLNLRHIWLNLHKALQLYKRKIAESSKLADSIQTKTTEGFEQERRRLIMLVKRVQQRSRIILQRQRLRSSDVLTKWRVKVAKN